jgi:DNA ligase-1
LLKLKRFETVDCKIVGTQEGKGKLKGCLGAILVDVSGVESRCGSGFDDETRTTLWSVKDSLIGKTVEVQYQNKSKDGALRFPVFIRMRPDKD